MKSMFKSLHLVFMSLAIMAMLGCEEKTNSNQEIKSGGENFNLFTGIDGTEIENLRSEYSKTFQLSNGKVVTRFSAQKVHELVNGQWIDIDYNKKPEKSAGIIEGSITGTLKYTRISNNITTTEYAPIFDNLGSYPGYLPDDQSVTYNNENSRLVVTFNGINNIPSGYRVRSSELALSNSIPTSGSVSRSEIYGDIDIKLFTSNSLYGTQVHYDACSVGTTLGTKKTGFFPVILDNSSLNNAVINAIPNNRVSFSLVSVGALCSITYTHLDIYLELIPRYSITTVVNPSGSGTISLSPAPGADGKYEQGTLVTATASPSSGWQFYNWSDANNSQSNQISFTVNSNASLNANFIKQLQINGPVELPTNGSATYTVTTIPDATTYKWYKLVKQTTYPYGTTYSYQSTGTSYVGVMGTGAIPLVLIMKVEAYDASNALRGSGIIAVEASEN